MTLAASARLVLPCGADQTGHTTLPPRKERASRDLRPIQRISARSTLFDSAATRGVRNGHPQVYYAEQGDPGGEPIVLIHPHADSWFSFSRVLSLLPARYHAYALDQRGHGDSERPACCYTIDDLATDIVAFLDGVGTTRAILVGHSASGFIARRLAETHPDRVARLVLINGAVTLPTQVRREIEAAVQGLQDPLPVAFARELQCKRRPPALARANLRVAGGQSLKAPARVWRDGLRVVPETGHSPHLERSEQIADDLDGSCERRPALTKEKSQGRSGVKTPQGRLTSVLVLQRLAGYCTAINQNATSSTLTGH
jgi:hypothetical protein